MLNSKSMTAIAAVVLGALSIPSQAAVVFTNYSYAYIAGYADDSSAGGSGLADYQVYNEMTTSPGSALESNFAAVSDVDGWNTAWAESYSEAFLGDVITYVDGAFIYGAVDSYAYEDIASSATNEAYAYSEAVIDLDFTLDSTYSYSFFSEWMEAQGAANVYYSLTQYDGSVDPVTGMPNDVAIANGFSGYIENDFISSFETGSLSAGDYRLVVEAISSADSLDGTIMEAGAYADFGLELTAVPVPAAVWLFASGLLGLAGVARRKAK